MSRYWIAIDWGTTNFRAFLMHGKTQIALISNSNGLLSIGKMGFSGTLQASLAPWLQQYGKLPIIMAGMVGSRQGWEEVPYVAMPCGISELVTGIRELTTPWGSPAWIVPGVNGMSAWQQPDVMRGEEVQLLGLNALHPASEHRVLLPGTHCKHVHMRDGEITAFSTFMTGELFSLLSMHSILGRDLPAQRENKEVFLQGVKAAQHNAPFSHALFSVRTLRLAEKIPEIYIHSYLSGLLIGHELTTLSEFNRVWIVGSSALITRYQLAAEQLSLSLYPANGDDCFVSGLELLFTLITGASI
ncbi:2-dehydro-3-deoxygalactonokinase [Salmonella enterica]|uniref:2-dehydro-3-deoxygalactonokinase n=3 Tax=Salmonella enterica TaxID=28901 RepID=A0A753W2D5_SALER|nr:2-dehydro-3-deoxygalactonokinase [Salmonella enterica subsp. enterica serovar Koketime]EAB8207405.1 2-dehydro-3-deoxygalactonokinase [Salmonella enterica subsp. enterica serovar Lattenkamp]EAM8931787.1 2-dehydro-3-deoxygalactonokinase [Salmonella enterica]EBY0371932.1 2-dehydro-3-deoxygalactonokinase [Salmonella enterica subsp. enterica serovar Toulon]ECJ3922984.1 2-dehydro-3-deoxygalactonokinase [Salmonella enterica subsp. enterica]EHG3458826.1 2-dehydro-3-deoxygalactonokinase [Salmonella 